jgi:hypothetical protein
MSNVARRIAEIGASLYGGAVFGLLLGFVVGGLASAMINPKHDDWAILATVVGPVAFVGLAVLVISLLTRRLREVSAGFSLGLFAAAFGWWWITSSFLGAPG